MDSAVATDTPLPAIDNCKLNNWKRKAGELRLHDFAAAQAGSTNADPLVRAADFRVNRAQIDVPAPLRHVMRVADVISKLRLLAAHCTHLSHYLLQERSELEVQTLDFTGFEPFSPTSPHSLLQALICVLLWTTPVSLRG